MKKRFLSVLSVLCMVLILLPETALAAVIDSGNCGDNVTWSLDESGTLTIRGVGKMGDFTYSVDESPAPWYSHHLSIKKVDIGNGVTSIGNSAFRNCSSLTSVAIPNSVVSIGKWAFDDCTSLKNITIPDSVTSIGFYAFGWCALDSVTIPQNIACVEAFTFYACRDLTHVAISEGVTSIGEQAFCDCRNLTSVAIPESVTEIGYAAFSDCNQLADVYYSGVETQWRNINIGYKNTSLNVATLHYSDSGLGDITGDAIASGECGAKGGNLIWALDNKGSLTIQGTGKMADYDDITMTPWQEYKSFIRTGYIAPGVTSIGTFFLKGCDNLTRVTIPESVTFIGEQAFQDCALLPSITLPKGITSLENSVLFGCHSLANLTIPEEVTEISDNALMGCKGLTNLIIPERVTTIRTFAFYGCCNLTNVTIPKSVERIMENAFDDCDKLSDVYYSGTMAQWKTIVVRQHNDPLISATIHCSDGSFVPSGVGTGICSISFNANGGTVTPVAMETNTDGKLAKLPIPAHNGFIFSGWYTSATGGERVDENRIYTEDTMLYAHWTQTEPDDDHLHGRIAISATFADDDSSGTAYTIGGETVTLRAYPDAGYRLSSIQVVGPNGQQVRLTQNGDTYTFAMPTFDVTVCPEFTKI